MKKWTCFLLIFFCAGLCAACAPTEQPALRPARTVAPPPGGLDAFLGLETDPLLASLTFDLDGDGIAELIELRDGGVPETPFLFLTVVGGPEPLTAAYLINPEANAAAFSLEITDGGMMLTARSLTDGSVLAFPLSVSGGELTVASGGVLIPLRLSAGEKE